jgi:hypothetical protein
MSKKPMTWLGLIKEKLGEEKAKGKAPSINDIMPLAKKEWAEIKAGKHPKYEQGKAQTFARKKKGEKKTKKNKGSSSKSGGASSPDVNDVLHEAKLCTKCKKKVDKVLKKKGMKGGSFAANAAPVGDEMTKQTGGTCGGTCTKAMNGGSCGGSCCSGQM